MVNYAKNRHTVAEKTEQYGDYIALVVGAISIAVVTGVLGAITLLPAADGGIFTFGETMFSVSGRTVTNGAVLASGAALFAYGTNEALDAFTNVQDKWQETEVAAFGVAALLPLLHDVFPFVSDLTAGEPVMQVAASAVYVGALSYVVNE